MGLGDLTLEGMEMYGGIEMKKNGKKLEQNLAHLF